MKTNDLSSQLNLEKIIVDCKTELYFSKNKKKDGDSMPEYFWEWYQSKEYDKVLSVEDGFKNKVFMIGCCIEYLTEKGQRITKLDEYDNLDEILNYLKVGVSWTR